MILSQAKKLGLLALVTLAFCVGCGSGNSAGRGTLSGKATFKGEPIPYGVIFFIPDASQGNSGPQGFAKIQNGTYRTDKEGMGTVSGPLIIQIAGYTEQNEPGSENTAPELFPKYQTKVTLEDGQTTMDFDVPGN